jgi:transcription antitermination factor NusG
MDHTTAIPVTYDDALTYDDASYGSETAAPSAAPESTDGAGPWHALWVRSNCERMVHDQLAAKGFRTLLPTTCVPSRAAGGAMMSVPMFPGYLFLNHHMDKASYIDAASTRGLVRILGERWDRLAVVPATEIHAIRRALDAGVNPVPHPYLRVGARVRMRRGPLVGIEGILLRSADEAGQLVLSVDLFQRSVAITVDCADAGPA